MYLFYMTMHLIYSLLFNKNGDIEIKDDCLFKYFKKF